MVFNQLIDKPVQASQFGDRLLLEIGVDDKVLVAVNDHAELSAPVAQVIVANHTMAEESKHSTECIADDRGTNVSHMHRLGDVGRREIDDNRFGISRLGHANSRIGAGQLHSV